MKIVAVCKMHPESAVHFLEGTVSMRNEDGQVQGDDSLENVTEVTIDEYNLYCTADDPFNHDIHFEVKLRAEQIDHLYCGHCGGIEDVRAVNLIEASRHLCVHCRTEILRWI